MKSEDAAKVLGVPPNADMDALKQAYRDLMHQWHPYKNKDPAAWTKFQEISIAYTIMITLQSEGDDLEMHDTDEDNPQGPYYDDHDMRKFVRDFMDMVGMLNDRESGVADSQAAALFGMRFDGSAEEDWSTDDEEDLDEDGAGRVEMEEDEMSDHDASWEPMVKHYCHMNLKEQVASARAQQNDVPISVEDKKKQRNAKKRQKQKQKRLREAERKSEEEELKRTQEEDEKRRSEELSKRNKEENRRKQQHEEHQRGLLFSLVASGDVQEVRSMLEDSRSFLRYSEREKQRGKAGASLLHACVSNYCVENAPDSLIVEGRLQIARYILSAKSPSVDLSVVDDDGRTVLHAAAACEDVHLMTLLLEERKTSPERRNQLDINGRCLNRDWTPLHYAANAGAIQTCQALMEAGALLNVHGGQSADSRIKGVTPLELARENIQSASSVQHRQRLEAVALELERRLQELEKLKSQREEERRQKEEEERAEQERVCLKVKKEQELLERKQKQLRDREKKREEEEDEARKKAGQRSAVLNDETSLKKKKKRSKKKKGSVDIIEQDGRVLELPENRPSVSETRSSDVADTGIGFRTDCSETDTLIVQSTDDLLGQLLSMGFADENCYAAVKKFGRNVEAAITWLCDRPNGGMPTGFSLYRRSVEKTSETVVGAENPAELVNEQSKDTKKTQAEAAAKKLADHNVQMRRINRVWNQNQINKRVEEERRAEFDRLQEIEFKTESLQHVQPHTLSGTAALDPYPDASVHYNTPDFGGVSTTKYANGRVTDATFSPITSQITPHAQLNGPSILEEHTRSDSKVPQRVQERKMRGYTSAHVQTRQMQGQTQQPPEVIPHLPQYTTDDPIGVRVRTLSARSEPTAALTYSPVLVGGTCDTPSHHYTDWPHKEFYDTNEEAAYTTSFNSGELSAGAKPFIPRHLLYADDGGASSVNLSSLNQVTQLEPASATLRFPTATANSSSGISDFSSYTPAESITMSPASLNFWGGLGLDDPAESSLKISRMLKPNLSEGSSRNALLSGSSGDVNGESAVIDELFGESFPASLLSATESPKSPPTSLFRGLFTSNTYTASHDISHLGVRNLQEPQLGLGVSDSNHFVFSSLLGFERHPHPHSLETANSGSGSTGLVYTDTQAAADDIAIVDDDYDMNITNITRSVLMQAGLLSYDSSDHDHDRDS